MKDKLKKIKKLAQEFPDVPGIPTSKTPVIAPAPVTAPSVQSTSQNNIPFGPPSPTKAPASNRSYQSSSLAQVKQMQKAILEFADVAAKTDVTALKGNQQGQQTR